MNLPGDSPIAELDEAAVGRCFINVLAASAACGHAHIANTARDYFHPAEDAWSESAFIYDAFMLRPNEAVSRWFGSMSVASFYITSTVADHVRAVSDE
jgi:hypothetical protein